MVDSKNINTFNIYPPFYRNILILEPQWNKLLASVVDSKNINTFNIYPPFYQSLLFL